MVKKFRAGESSKRKSLPRARRRTDGSEMKCRLKPAAFVRDVGVDEILVTLGKVDDALDEANHAAKATSAHGDHDLDDSFLRVTEVKLVDGQTTQQDAENSGDDFLFRSRRFIAHSF
jgi:hypothetical protein